MLCVEVEVGDCLFFCRLRNFAISMLLLFFFFGFLLGDLNLGEFLVQEAIKCMRHSRRTILTADDVDSALSLRNVEVPWRLIL